MFAPRHADQNRRHESPSKPPLCKVESDPEPIAVVGMGCRLPGGISNPSELWELLSTKRTGYRDFGEDRLNIGGFYHPDHERPGSIHTRGACLLEKDPRLFDPTFFGMTTAEVTTMDPLQRKLLEVTYEAFENAGEPWDKFSGSCTGIFIGNYNSDHSIMEMYDVDFPLPYAPTGGGTSILSNRINHIFNLRGPRTTNLIIEKQRHSATEVYSTMTNRPVIECYFSFISSWSYIGSRRLQLLAQENNAEIIYKPIDIMHLFSISGGLPVKERSLQRQAYRLVEIERWSKIRDIPIVQHPKFYPANPSLAHRVFLAAVEEADHDSEPVQEFARKAMATVWANEGDIADPITISKLADEVGLDGARLLKRAEAEEGLAEQEKALTEEARARQIFGAPSYFYRNELFWGQDRLEMLEDVIRSKRDAILLPVVE